MERCDAVRNAILSAVVPGMPPAEAFRVAEILFSIQIAAMDSDDARAEACLPALQKALLEAGAPEAVLVVVDGPYWLPGS